MSALIKYFKVLPENFFFDQFVNETRRELKEECDYIVESKKQLKYKRLLKEYGLEEDYLVPEVIDELTTKRVFVSEYLTGLTIEDIANNSSQEVRNYVGNLIMKHTVEEFFTMNFMQTDPNFSNFFFDKNKLKLILLDFGAATAYDKNFAKLYQQIILAGVDKDIDKVKHLSKDLGFFTGEENEDLISYHYKSM